MQTALPYFRYEQDLLHTHADARSDARARLAAFPGPWACPQGTIEALPVSGEQGSLRQEDARHDQAPGCAGGD